MRKSLRGEREATLDVVCVAHGPLANMAIHDKPTLATEGALLHSMVRQITLCGVHLPPDCGRDIEKVLIMRVFSL
jgi:hypothetical protein